MRISRSPPSNGVNCSAVLAIRGTVIMPIMSAPPTKRCEMFAALIAARLNIASGMSGESVRPWRNTNSTSAAADAPR